VALEPQEWRHYLRLAWVSWGGGRLTAANRVLSFRPGLALAHWFAATVFVARGAFDPATEHLVAGCVAQDAQGSDGRFAAVGLHWLYGLVLAARGELDAARAEFARELALENPGHIYGRECAANTWYAIGAIALLRGKRDEACAAFQEALARVPGHALAAVGLAACSQSLVPGSSVLLRSSSLNVTGDSSLVHTSDPVARATVAAAVLTLQGKHEEAARVCGDALIGLGTDPGSSGWLLPVEPLLHATAHPEAWAGTLATLRDRAT
jgi:tetratricopeptide (TPR) repeat protein